MCLVFPGRGIVPFLGIVASGMTGDVARQGIREWRCLVHTDSVLSWEHWDPLKDFGPRNGKSIPEASKQLESGPAQSGRQISLEDTVNSLAVEMQVGRGGKSRKKGFKAFSELESRWKYG